MGGKLYCERVTYMISTQMSKLVAITTNTPQRLATYKFRPNAVSLKIYQDIQRVECLQKLNNK